jgi:predicted permease
VQRRGELAMRAALGAGRGRLVRQLLTESVLLAAVGGVLALVVARLGVDTLVAMSPSELPRVSAITLDARALAFGTAVTLFVGIVIGLVPALHVSRRDLYGDTQRSARRTTGGHRLTRGTLVVAEVALALVLLVSAGLLLRSLERLFAVAPGFVPERGITMQVQLSGHRYDDDGATLRFYEQALDAVRRVPGVASASFTSQLPLSGDFDKYGVRSEFAPQARADDDWSAFRYAIMPGYIETTGIRLLRGRPLSAVDGSAAPRAALVSESLVKHRLEGREPIGQRIHIGGDEEPWYTIVGVVGDVKQTSLAMGAADAVYIAPAQWRFVDRAMWLVVRARGDAASLAPALQRAIWSIDKDQPIVRVSTLEALVAASAAERRFALTLFEAFALAALALSATGIFGVVSGSVTERLREIGVRAALGASRGDILGMVVKQGMALTALGVVLGLLGGAAASRALSAMLFGISASDPLTYIGVVLVLASVAAVACAIPAWRAARVDPTITLRADA